MSEAGNELLRLGNTILAKRRERDKTVVKREREEISKASFFCYLGSNEAADVMRENTSIEFAENEMSKSNTQSLSVKASTIKAFPCCK